jgi:MscS family membrane protein
MDLEVFAYATTPDWGEFLGIQEDILLRMADIVTESGTSFALPSQTLYLARGREPDPEKTRRAETEVRQWREDRQLPFPNFSPEQIAQIRGSLIYPPPGSPESPSKPPQQSAPGQVTTAKPATSPASGPATPGQPALRS